MSLENKISIVSIGIMTAAAFADVYMTTNLAQQCGTQGELNPIARNIMHYAGIHAGAYTFKAVSIPLAITLAKKVESNLIIHYATLCSTFGAISNYLI